MVYTIRGWTKLNIPCCKIFYMKPYIPEGVEAPPRSVIDLPELQVYISDFSKHPHDQAMIAEINGKIIGAVWVRIMNDYGHIDDETPSFSISLYKEYRGKGIGTALMRSMLVYLKEKGYKKASLSVQKENYAVKMYQKLGFQIIDENPEEYIMAIYFV